MRKKPAFPNTVVRTIFRKAGHWKSPLRLPVAAMPQGFFFLYSGKLPVSNSLATCRLPEPEPLLPPYGRDGSP